MPRPAGPAAYACSLYDSIDLVPAAEWDAIIAADPDLTMDRRLLRTFERTIGEQCRCWYVIVRDAAGVPAAAACLARFVVDALDSSGPVARKLTAAVRSVWPGCLQFGVLFCGLPIPSGQSHLRFRAGADGSAVVSALSTTMLDLARRHKARLVVFKEFDDAQCAQLSCLPGLGYARGEIPPMHTLAGRFANFDAYAAALKARYRQQVTRSRKKLAEAGFAASRVSGADIAGVYTDAVHALYSAVRGRSKTKLEHLPAEFFRDAGRAFGPDASLTLLTRGGKIAAFTFSLANARVYHNLYSGLDYALNAEGDLYFNLFYEDLDHAFGRGTPEIHLGQTSDDFKSRLGTAQRPLWFYVRAVNPVINWGLRRASRWAFPPIHKAEGHDVFKSQGQKKRGEPPRRQDAKEEEN